MKKYVVVFDIDDALCKISSPSKLEAIKTANPECPIIVYESEDLDKYPHVFIPYLEILFEYLVAHEVRIVFFSSAIEHRNVTVVPELLTHILGRERYEALKSQGQFEIFSRQHLRPGKHAFREQGGNIKDMAKVIKEGEDLLNAVLIEDQPTYTAHDQKPCITVMDSAHWGVTAPSNSSDTLSKNATYHLLGIFKTYFESSEYNQMPLRKGMENILPGVLLSKNERCEIDEKPFIHKMICLGLGEVKKTHPEAILYASEHFKKHGLEDF